MAWTDEMIEGLKKMWDEGLTTGEIGKRLGVSKNSIVGKVHRLKLTSRPSPIKKKEEAPKVVKEIKQEPVVKKAEEPKPVQRIPAPRIEPKVEEKKPAPAPKIEEPKKFEEFIKIEPIACATPKKTGDRITVTELDGHTCRWPIGDPKDENFHFCGKKVRAGQTYCEEHAAIAYVKAPRR